MTLEHSVTKNPVEEAKLNAALEALEAARELQRMRRSHGVNRIELLVDDVDGDWLEQWGEDEVLDSEEFQEKLDYFVATARKEEFQKDIQKIEEKIAETDQEIQDFKAKFISKIQRAYQDLPAAIPVQLSSRESSENLTEPPLSFAKNIEVIKNLSHLVAFQPTAENYFRLGNACVLEGRYEEAIANFDNALKLNSQNHEAWNNRGVSLDNLGRHEEAIISYEEALKLKANYPEAWSNFGVSLRNLERHEEGIIKYNISLELNPAFHEAFTNRGVSLSKLGCYEQAISDHDKAIMLKPDEGGYWFNKACVCSLQSDVNQTVENLAQAIKWNPIYKEIAKTDPDFNLIRSDERFVKLLED
jgi:tetratricopeptide (TPR) repeat protein